MASLPAVRSGSSLPKLKSPSPECRWFQENSTVPGLKTAQRCLCVVTAAHLHVVFDPRQVILVNDCPKFVLELLLILSHGFPVASVSLAWPSSPLPLLLDFPAREMPHCKTGTPTAMTADPNGTDAFQRCMHAASRARRIWKRPKSRSCTCSVISRRLVCKPPEPHMTSAVSATHSTPTIRRTGNSVGNAMAAQQLCGGDAPQRPHQRCACVSSCPVPALLRSYGAPPPHLQRHRHRSRHRCRCHRSQMQPLSPPPPTTCHPCQPTSRGPLQKHTPLARSVLPFSRRVVTPCLHMRAATGDSMITAR